MLRHFEHKAVAVIGCLERVENFRQMPVELHVDNGADDLCDATRCNACRSRFRGALGGNWRFRCCRLGCCLVGCCWLSCPREGCCLLGCGWVGCPLGGRQDIPIKSVLQVRSMSEV